MTDLLCAKLGATIVTIDKVKNECIKKYKVRRFSPINIAANIHSICAYSRLSIFKKYKYFKKCIPARVSFLVEVFSVFSLNCKMDVKKFRPHLFQNSIWLS